MKTAEHPPKLCPRFDSCSVNNCPLGPAYPNRLVHPDDNQKSCPMEKSVRARIAKRFPGLLPMQGLTRPEYAGKMAFDQKPVALKCQLAQQGRDSLKRLRNGFSLQTARPATPSEVPL